MPRKNLTARFCDSVRVEERTDFQDELVRGLWLRVSPGGSKIWNVVYTQPDDGKKRRVKLGNFPAMTLEKARNGALKMVTSVSEGDDPADKRRAQRNALTVKELGALFIEKYSKRQKRTWAEDERLLKVEVYPQIGDMKAETVKRRHVLDIIEAKADAGFIAQSTQILATIRKMFNWAVDNDYLPSSPATGVKPRGKPVKRDRVLSDDEVRQLLKALPGAALSEPTRQIFSLLLLTGQRSGEVCGMRRSEVDLDRAIWTIPAKRTKNGLAHVVPLSDAAAAILTVAIARAGEEPGAAVFTKIGEPIESNAIAHAARLKLQIFGEPWTPHDLRRTVATGVSGLGVAPHIVESVLNHISGFRAGVAGVYNRNQYEPEKRRALNLWAEHLAAIERNEKKVVTFRSRVGEGA